MKNIVFINGARTPIELGRHTGLTLKQKLGIECDHKLALDIDGEIDIPVEDRDVIILCGKERFTSALSFDLPDTSCLRAPIDNSINDKSFAIAKTKVTANDLRSLVPNVSDTETVYIDVDDSPDVALTNGERLINHKPLSFITAPCGNVGDLDSEVMVSLPPALKKDFLDLQQTYPSARLHKESSGWLLVLENVAIPEHWSSECISILIQVPRGYPQSPLDMFFVSPDLLLNNGARPAMADHKAAFLGSSWQRFSWHYKGHAWSPTRDTLLSHVRFCLTRFRSSK